MKLIVGLGNPGKTYENTRHNAGFMVIDRLASRHAPATTVRSKFNSALVEAKIAGEPCLLMKPLNFMNRSGGPVAEAVRFYKLSPASDLLVLVDDVALPTGAIRLRAGGGAGGHNGLTDIQRALGANDWPRCRIGIDASPSYMDQADYVLGRFSPEEWALMEPALGKAADAAELFIARGITAAMNTFNASSPSASSPPSSSQPGPPAPKKDKPAQPQEPPADAWPTGPGGA